MRLPGTYREISSGVPELHSDAGEVTAQLSVRVVDSYECTYPCVAYTESP